MQVLDVRVDICLPGDADPALGDRIAHAWHHCVADSGELAPREVRWLGSDEMTGMHLLSQDVTRAAIDARAGDALMLHAAAIASPDTGAALVAVGASGAGKTTWVQAHGRQRRYLSDETVLITSDLRVFGVSKPLSVGHRGLKAQHAPEEFGLLPAEGGEHLAGIWLLDRDGTTPAQLANVDLLDAIPLLAQQASYLATLERPLHQLASVVTACGGLRRARYREAGDLADLVAESLA